MSNDEQKSQAVEDLKFVRKIMENCAKKQQDDGIYYIVWGGIVPIATVLTYLFIQLEKFTAISWLWVFSIALGFVISFFVGKNRNTKKAQTQGEKLQSIIWLACYISLFLMAVSAYISKTIGFNETMAMLSFILAIAVFVSGFLSGTTLLKIMAIGWWITGFICSFTTGYNASIVVAISTFCLFFIPGIILYNRAKKTKNEVL